MASNSFGSIFRITTWGESHGIAIGVVIDGCPAGLELSENDLHEALLLRAPGKSAFTSPRAEKDRAQIYSGVFEGKTTGAPISIIIYNQDVRSEHYDTIKSQLRPGHANFTYLEKYGVFDYRGGGRASARETAVRVAAAAVANKILIRENIHCCAYLSQVSEHKVNSEIIPEVELRDRTYNDPIYCPDKNVSEEIQKKILSLKDQGDSIGGIVNFIVKGLPVGLGDPIYEKLESNLAKAMMSIPASKGFEIGEGFSVVDSLGSDHNDSYIIKNDKIETSSNHAGGILAGISTGMNILGRVAFKPASSILKPQMTLDTQGEPVLLKLPEGSRHDPCVAIRAVPVVEAMCCLVLADAILMNRSSKLY